MNTQRDAGRQWARLLEKLRALADEYGRVRAGRRTLHFAAMHSTLLTLVQIAELHGGSGPGWMTLMACAPPDGSGLRARLSISIIGSSSP